MLQVHNKLAISMMHSYSLILHHEFDDQIGVAE